MTSSPWPQPARPRPWRRLAGYRQRHFVTSLSRPELAVIEYQLAVPARSPLGERKLLFFSDLHWPVRISQLTERCAAIWSQSRPDWVVFGGDLATHACHLTATLDFLRQLPPPGIPPAIAVHGNWDRRRRWYPHARLRAALAETGFQLLVNESRQVGDIVFHGFEAPHRGMPKMPPRPPDLRAPCRLRCIVSHAVDQVIAASTNPEFAFDLALCGHSHGGQVRIPGFGAVVTSSRHWKRFEYGHYRQLIGERASRDLIVSAGIGCSRIPLRWFCQPEIVMIRFTAERAAGA